MIAAITRAARLVKLRLLQATLDGFDQVGRCDQTSQRIAADELRLRAELTSTAMPCRAHVGRVDTSLLDDYEIVESQAWLGEPGRFKN